MEEKKKLAFYKRWWVWLIIVIITIVTVCAFNNYKVWYIKAELNKIIRNSSIHELNNNSIEISLYFGGLDEMGDGSNEIAYEVGNLISKIQNYNWYKYAYIDFYVEGYGILTSMEFNMKTKISKQHIWAEQEDNASTTITSQEEEQQEKQEEINVYKLNDEVSLWNSEQEYTIMITGIKEMKERNQFSDKNPSQVFLIDYTYKNKKGNELYISESNFTIIDEAGEVGDSYPNNISNYPKSVPVGATCKAQMILCVNNKSNKILLQYKDNMFQNKADIVFEIEI